MIWVGFANDPADAGYPDLLRAAVPEEKLVAMLDIIPEKVTGCVIPDPVPGGRLPRHFGQVCNRKRLWFRLEQPVSTRHLRLLNVCIPRFRYYPGMPQHKKKQVIVSEMRVFMIDLAKKSATFPEYYEVPACGISWKQTQELES